MQTIFAKIISIITSILMFFGVITPPAMPPVKLVPVNETSTAMIDRGGITESYNEGYSVITDTYNYEKPSAEKDVASFYNEWIVYGLAENLTIDKLLTDFVTVQGDGYAKVTTNIGDNVGSGSVIEVYDRNGTEDTSDDKFVERFYVVIYGDINGDGLITTADEDMATCETLGITSWSSTRSPHYCYWQTKAGDINADGRVKTIDASWISGYCVDYYPIDQTTPVYRK